MRSNRRLFTPSPPIGPYRLPRDVQERLTAALAPFRNRDAAFALATFLARFWSVPGRITESFPIDRRELANRPDLGLTEDRIRGAIRVLEDIGFLDRALASGSKYKPTEEGLRRKPILFVFGPEYAPAFIAANRRASVARGRRSQDRRPIAPSVLPRPSTAFLEPRPLNSPKSKSEAERTVIMGEVKRQSSFPPKSFEPNSRLEAALDRLWQGFRHSRGG